MAQNRLEPGAYPPKDKLTPVKGADGMYRLTEIRHRSISGEIVRTSGSGRTKRDCLDDFNRRFQINVRKGSVFKRTTRRRKFAPTDKMSVVFDAFKEQERRRWERGEISEAAFNKVWYDIYPSTHRNARSDSPKLMRTMGNLSILEASDPSFLADYFEDLGEVKPGVAANHYSTLRAVFRMVLLGGQAIEGNVHPMQWIGAPKGGGGSQRALKAAERPRLYACLEQWRVADHRRLQCITIYYLLVLGTGARPGEAQAIRWDDIPELDTEDNPVAYVCGTIKRATGKGLYRQAWRKRGKPYYVTLPKWLTYALRAWKAVVQPTDGQQLIIVSGRANSNEVLNPKSLRDALVQARAGSEFDWFKWGNCRDTVATHVTDATGDHKLASAQLGHSEGSTMAQRHYIDPEGLKRMAVDNSAVLEELNPQSDGNRTENAA